MVGWTDSMNKNLSKLQKMVKDREGWYTAVRGVTKSWIQLNNRMTSICVCIYICICAYIYTRAYIYTYTYNWVRVRKKMKKALIL